MRRNQVNFLLLILFILIAFMTFSQYKILHHSDPVVESLIDISKNKSNDFFSAEQTDKLSKYFLSLKEKGYTNPTFEPFLAADENRLYILVDTDYKEKGHNGISYIVLDYERDGETIKNIITSGWIKIGETIKNF